MTLCLSFTSVLTFSYSTVQVTVFNLKKKLFSFVVLFPQLTKFQAAREIPALFIERNVRLRGKVHSITEKGIEVEHVPIYLPVLSTLLSKRGKMGEGFFKVNHVF